MHDLALDLESRNKQSLIETLNRLGGLTCLRCHRKLGSAPDLENCPDEFHHKTYRFLGNIATIIGAARCASCGVLSDISWQKTVFMTGHDVYGDGEFCFSCLYVNFENPDRG